MSEESFSHNQHFQQAIATTITCRTIIKYNTNLSATEKAEILGEIENTLAFLEKRLEVASTIATAPALVPEKLLDLLATDVEGELSHDDPAELRWPANPAREEPQLLLQSLHRLYNAYLSDQPGRGIAELEARYKNVMGVLEQLQDIATRRHDATSGDLNAERLVHRVQGFVTAIYYMFREFASLLSRIVEGQSIDLDTEAMGLIQHYPLPSLPSQFVRDVTPLLTIYHKQRQLQQNRGTLLDCTRDATAFLIFLQKNLVGSSIRQPEIANQIKATINLLHELTGLLMDYEQAVEHIIQAPSASH